MPIDPITFASYGLTLTTDTLVLPPPMSITTIVLSCSAVNANEAAAAADSFTTLTTSNPASDAIQGKDSFLHYHNESYCMTG